MTSDMQRNGRTTKAQGLKDLPLDAGPRRAHPENPYKNLKIKMRLIDGPGRR
jgi:hypothetical protein